MKGRKDKVGGFAEGKYLNEQSDVKKLFDLVKSGRSGEVKMMLAWWDGHSLRLAASFEELNDLPTHTEIKTGIVRNKVVRETVDLPTKPRTVIWCVAINEGDGFNIVGHDGHDYDVERRLRSVPVNNALSPSQPSFSMPVKADVQSWLEKQRNELKLMCHQIAEIDKRFGELWREHEEAEITHDGWPPELFGWPSTKEFPHTLEVAIDAFRALHNLHFSLTDRLREVQAPTNGQPLLTHPYVLSTLMVRVARESHNAGVCAKALQAIVSNHRTLSTLGAAKNVQRQIGQRALFILENDVSFTKELGKRPSTAELMKYLDGRKDPESGQTITAYTDDDGTQMIQWADDQKQTRNQFAVKVSELRRKSRKKSIRLSAIA